MKGSGVATWKVAVATWALGAPTPAGTSGLASRDMVLDVYDCYTAATML